MERDITNIHGRRNAIYTNTINRGEYMTNAIPLIFAAFLAGVFVVFIIKVISRLIDFLIEDFEGGQDWKLNHTKKRRRK